MANHEYKILSEDAIKYLCGLIRDVSTLPSSLIDDINVQTVTSYSSFKLEQLLATLKQENDVIITEFINKATGLTQENVDKLFDRFYTVDNSRSDRNTGLGLYITKILVEKLGHNIKANLKEDNLVISITWKKN